MTTATEWDTALDELRERGARWAALRPYCEALLPVVERLRVDSRVGTVVLQVSHATLVIGVTGGDRRVGLGWHHLDQYQCSSSMLSSSSSISDVSPRTRRLTS